MSTTGSSDQRAVESGDGSSDRRVVESGESGESGDRRVVVVTGGGGGIGAAIALELGRQGAFVVTVDPLVSVDGSERLPPPADTDDTTAGRIVAAGGAAQASSASVTDREAIGRLFAELVDAHGRLDAVVNVAGITRPTGFAKGTDEDWAAVLSVHLDGYRNVLDAALPIMAAAGHGHILGVTSGSGWRAADAGAYSCAKRAVASLTWQVGRAAPPGVVINAISPIAVTRMVTAALARATGRPEPTGSGTAPGESATSGSATSGSATSVSATGGLSLGSMPEPEALGPFGSYLVDPDLQWCRGQVLFAGGSEVAVVEPPRLLEVIRTDGAASLAQVMQSTSAALVTAEGSQATTGATNPRFPTLFARPAADPTDAAEPLAHAADATDASEPATEPGTDDGSPRRGPRPTSGHVVLVRAASAADDQVLDGLAPGGDPLAAALSARDSWRWTRVSERARRSTIDAARRALDEAAQAEGPIDAVIVAVSGGTESAGEPGWPAILAQHEGIADQIAGDAAWARAVADHAAAHRRPVRLVTLVDATSAGGRSRAQAAAQLSRAARKATGGRVAAVAISVEATDEAESDVAPIACELAAHLVTGDDDALAGLSGAELVVGDGWFGLRSHPRPTGSIVVGPPPLPDWFDHALRAVVEGS